MEKACLSLKFKSILIIFLLFFIAILVLFNFWLSYSEKQRQPVYFTTSAGYKIRCPLGNNKDCLAGKLNEFKDGSNEMIFKLKKGTEFYSSIKGELSYVSTGIGADMETAVLFPSLLLENKEKRIRYIFSGETVPGLRMVKEGEKIGSLKESLVKDKEANLIIWAEENHKRLRIEK